VPSIVVNGVESHYVEDDLTDPWRSDRETVLIQHGIGRNAARWNRWVPLLAGTYRVIRRDLPGHGKSPDPGPDYDWSAARLLADMEAFIEELDIAPVHYIGESTGGVVGIALAARRPELLRTLTVCSTPLKVPLTGASAGHKADIVTALSELGSAGWVESLMEARVLTRGPDSTYLDWALDEARATPEHVFAGVTKAVSQFDLRPHLKDVTTPTLILAPAQSPLTPLADQVEARAEIPNARITVIEGSGHEIFLDFASECAQAVTRFLASV
jgi:pimeloyl-ACP methyl ester carboxylesterase